MGDHDVLARRHLPEDGRLLEGPHHPLPGDEMRRLSRDILAFEEDAAGGRPVRAGHQLEDRALPRSVGPDDAEDLVLVRVKTHVVHGHQAAKPFRERPDLQDDVPLGRRVNAPGDRAPQGLRPRAATRRASAGPGKIHTAGGPFGGDAQAQQPVGQPEHGEDHDRGVDERLVLAESGQHLEAQEQGEGPDHRAEDVRETAEEAVEHEVDGVRHAEARWIDALLRDREERPADPSVGAADREGHHAVLCHIDAGALGERFVLLEGAEDPPQPAGGDPVGSQQPRAQDHRGQAIEREVQVEGSEGGDDLGPEDPERAWSRNVEDAGGALGEGPPVEGGEPGRLGEAERQHREVDALEAQDGPSDDGAEQRRRQPGRRQRQPE